MTLLKGICKENVLNKLFHPCMFEKLKIELRHVCTNRPEQQRSLDVEIRQSALWRVLKKLVECQNKLVSRRKEIYNSPIHILELKH